MEGLNSQVMRYLCEDARAELRERNWKEGDPFEFTNMMELMFCYAFLGHKPVGVNRHFMMLLLHRKFCTFLDRQIPVQVLWDYLASMYNIEDLHESEILPFPNAEVDYELPEDCYDLLKSKFGITLYDNSSDEDESPKISEASKISKKLSALKIKPSSSTPGPSKSNFPVPSLNKPSKSQAAVKSEMKTSTGDGTPKNKQDCAPSFKTHKFKHSTGSTYHKTVKSDHLSATKTDSFDVSSIKKNKSERGSSPAITKKPAKIESNLVSSASKKVIKSESATAESRPAKEQAPEGSVKKNKSDKDILSKKKVTSHSSDMSVNKKNIKTENVQSVKKRHDPESTPRKVNEGSSTKYVKSEMKNASQSTMGKDREIPQASGSRKSSPVVKVRSCDSSKKAPRKIPPEEPLPRKSIPGPKRRRAT